MLKQLIQWLLDSRTTAAEAAHSAMPSSSYVTVTATAVQAWGEMAKGVATFDGFVRVSARATSSNANVRVTNDTAAMFSQIEATASGQTQGVFVPVAKGDSWSVFGTNRDNPVVRVVKAIGGGYNCFVRRAQSCLKPSFNYLPRSSFRTNPNGLAVKHTHQSGLLFHSALQNTFLQRMGIWDFTNLKETQTTPLMCMRLGQMETLFHEKLLHSQLQQVTLPSRVSYLLRKATGWLLAAPSMSYGSHQQWGVNTNLRTGGELC